MAEKPQTQPQNSESSLKSNNNGGKSTTNKRAIWDCGSTLYDSFELDSFKKQLDSAIISSSRTHSMPRHLPSDLLRMAAPPLPPPPEKTKPATVSKKLSRSFQKLLRSVFKRSSGSGSGSGSGSEASNDSRSSSPDPWFLGPPAQTEKEKVDGGRYFVTYEKPNGLSTIPEAPEIGLSPEVGPLVRKTMSDRFRVASVGIYCA